MFGIPAHGGSAKAVHPQQQVLTTLHTPELIMHWTLVNTDRMGHNVTGNSSPELKGAIHEQLEGEWICPRKSQIEKDERVNE
jgi:hypothetical protein